jgi:thymidylate synthase (FAD)
LLISGSVRAFRELILFHGQPKIVQAIARFFIDRHPRMFFDLKAQGLAADVAGISIVKVPLAAVDQLDTSLKARHRHIAVKFYVNRAVTHEIVRHRPCSYLQESQRYCRYSESKFDNQVTFIKPMFFKEGSDEYKLWEQAMSVTEDIYLKLLATSSPQAARTVLPNSCKTELITYANLVEWYHIFKLRTSPGAEPSMREVMNPLLGKFQERFPGIFDDLKPAGIA